MTATTRPATRRPWLPTSEAAASVSGASGTGPDLHLEVGERDTAVLGHEPGVLHVEALHPVRSDRVRMHREDQVRRELGLDALADPRVLDHRHPDRVARHVAEVIATLGEPGRDGAVDVVRGRARAQSRLRDLVVL